MMEKLFAVDWQAMFVPATGLAEVALRGTLMYLALFVILRFMARRPAFRSGGPAGNCVDRGCLAERARRRIPLGAEGALLVVTIVAWDYELTGWLGAFPRCDPFCAHPL